VRPGGRLHETTEPLGAVFAPVPGRSLKPAYAYGSPSARAKDVLFQCPVSAIPEVVWTLLDHWRSCRLMGCLPVAGGWVDQPLLVRRAFPIFEQEMRGWEASRSGAGSTEAMAALLAAMKGGRRP
jgi:hypothetical protein